ncbi:hypothetical protein [Methylobacterium platani]|nr:hypothetical protein [Methylobacterium platani]
MLPAPRPGPGPPPAPADPRHMAENLRAGTGPLPDATLRRRMAATLPA